MPLIEKNHIQICNDSLSWEKAIDFASQPLITDNYITQAYVDDMIGNVKSLGSYIVIAPGFALAHAQVSDSVLKTGMSLAIFKRDVNFNCGNDPVNVMIVLASKNSEEHLDKLGKIAEMLSDKELNLIESLKNTSSIKEAYALINQ